MLSSGRRPRESQPLLENKTLLVTGIANTESIAFATALHAASAGARLVLTAFPRDLDAALACTKELPVRAPVLPLDLTDAQQVADVRDQLRAAVGHLDGALHAIAFAPPDALQSLLGVPSDATETAFRTSVHSYVMLAQLLADLAPTSGASLVGLDFDASRAWPVYNWMGVCKAALESTNQYLARHLGPRRIRANLIAAGPLVTRAASAIPGFDELLRAWQHAPLPWNEKDATPVAHAACFLLSDLSAAITGEILHVDGGHHVLAATPATDRA
jgi:enoyl-[acyl-carrier protein] reductase I